MKKNKIIGCIAIFILLIISTMTVSYGLGINNLGGKTPSQADDINNAIGKIITIVTTVGSITSVIVLITLGIKYMIGSVDEKAQYKKTMMPYFIGAVFVFGASSIAGVIYNLAINL